MAKASEVTAPLEDFRALTVKSVTDQMVAAFAKSA